MGNFMGSIKRYGHTTFSLQIVLLDLYGTISAIIARVSVPLTFLMSRKPKIHYEAMALQRVPLDLHIVHKGTHILVILEASEFVELVAVRP